MSGPATYLYALARTGARDLEDVRGIGGEPVRLVGRAGLACVVSSVDLAEFGAGPLRSNLADLAWLERVAREHDAVVQAVAAAMPVLPLRLGTVCADDESAGRRVEDVRAAAETALDLVADRDEWGVKMYAVPAREPAAVGPAERPASGLAYLKQRRAEVDRRAVEAMAAAEDADALFEALREHSVLAARHRLQDPALSGIRYPMLLNAAFLVDRDRAAGFRAAVDHVAGAHAPDAVVLTGPWPPYSFVALDDA